MTGQKQKVLVVDDHALLWHIVKSTLDESDVERVEWAKNGRDALSKINAAAVLNELYDIVFLDWNMPEVNGLEVLDVCRRNLRRSPLAHLRQWHTGGGN